MSFSKPLVGFCMLLILVLGIEQSNGQSYKKVGVKKLPYHTITVAKSGSANFTTIQSAIDSIPSDNKFWVCIRIKAGLYREKVKIPYDKPYIMLKGRGKRQTQVVWHDHDSISQSPTFTSLADNIVVKGLTFKNSYNDPENKNPRSPAVAAMVTGDKTRFIRVGFFGLQDTLWDDQGRHYYQRCTIQGAVDFIFGGGQSLFEGCSISVCGEDLEPGYVGFITAQGRTNPSDANGFVFKSCNVFGTGSAYLGRPWRAYSRVLFHNSNLSDVVAPPGWDAWQFTGHEHQLTFGEEGCVGAGSDRSQRVKWEKKMSKETVEKLTSLSFINLDNWIQDQPY